MGVGDYLRIFRRHWQIGLAFVVVALGVAFVTSPADTGSAYEATSVIGRDAPTASGDAPVPLFEGGVQDLLADDALVDQAAVGLTRGGDIDDMADAVTATADPRRGTVAVMATADTADQAVAVANAFAEALVGVLNAGEAARVDEAADTAATAERTLREQLTTLRAELATAEGDEADDIQAEIDDIANRLGTTAAAPSSPSTLYASFETADEATSVDRVVPGGTRTQRMLLAAVVALMLAAGVSITVDRADGRIVTRQHAERRFRLPVAAEVPLLPVRDRHRAAVFAYHRHPGVAAAYRRLRDGLGQPEPEFRDDDITTWTGNLDDVPARRRVVVVTSAEHRDGKSTTAANLAIAFAEAGEKTLLLQWDLVRPLPARVLGADEGSGLAEVLRGEGTLDSFLQETSEDRLSFVPAGSVGDLPDKASPQVATALDATRRLADVVVVDTAPVLSSEVTKQLVTLADVVLVSCSAGGTSAPAAERCSELLEQLDAPAVGVVLVGVPSGRGAGVRARSAAAVPAPAEPVAS